MAILGQWARGSYNAKIMLLLQLQRQQRRRKWNFLSLEDLLVPRTLLYFRKKHFFQIFFFLGLKEHLLFSSFTQKIFFYLNVYYPKNEFQKIGKSGTKPTFTIRDDAKCFPVVSSHYCFWFNQFNQFCPCYIFILSKCAFLVTIHYQDGTSIQAKDRD